MSARFTARLDARVRANAELARVPLTEWQAMSRRERRRRVQAARGVSPDRPATLVVEAAGPLTIHCDRCRDRLAGPVAFETDSIHLAALTALQRIHDEECGIDLSVGSS